MKKITKDQMNDAYFRTLFLSSKMEELEGIISGMGASLGVTDENGRAVPEKIDELTKGMVESLAHYLDLEGRKLQKWEKDMYTGFLHCALQLVTLKKNRQDPSMGVLDVPRTFQDIIRAAEEAAADTEKLNSYRDFQKLIYNRYRESNRTMFNSMQGIQDSMEGGGRITGFCRKIMNDLADCMDIPFESEMFVIDIPHDRQVELCKEYAKEHGISDKDNEFFLLLADDPKKFHSDFKQWCDDYIDTNGYTAYVQDFFDENYIPLEDFVKFNMPVEGEEEAIEARNEYLRYRNRIEALKSADAIDSVSRNELLSNLTPNEFRELQSDIISGKNDGVKREWAHYTGNLDADWLSESFRTFVKLYYDHDRSDFRSNVESMVQVYLIEHGYSVLGSEDAFGLVMYQAERAKKRIAAEVERRVNG